MMEASSHHPPPLVPFPTSCFQSPCPWLLEGTQPRGTGLEWIHPEAESS